VAAIPVFRATRRLTSACSGRGPLFCWIPSAVPLRIAGHAAEARVRWVALGRPENVNTRTSIAIAAAGLGIAALIAAALFPPLRLAGLPLAVVGLFVAASLLSIAGKLATQLRDLRGQSVLVRVWGVPPEGPGIATFRVHSVRALSAGLHFWLQRSSGGGLTHLKVAQPRSASRTSAEFRVESAAYVQWSGKRLPRREGTAALVFDISQFAPPN
jgi:hypothetical protein